MSGGCLEGVLRVSGSSLGGALRMSGGYLWDVRMAGKTGLRLEFDSGVGPTCFYFFMGGGGWGSRGSEMVR